MYEKKSDVNVIELRFLAVIGCPQIFWSMTSGGRERLKTVL